jgi:hypothetical protein
VPIARLANVVTAALLVAMLAAGAGLTDTPPAARADGDLASDILLGANVF